MCDRLTASIELGHIPNMRGNEGLPDVSVECLLGWSVQVSHYQNMAESKVFFWNLKDIRAGLKTLHIHLSMKQLFFLCSSRVQSEMLRFTVSPMEN